MHKWRNSGPGCRLVKGSLFYFESEEYGQLLLGALHHSRQVRAGCSRGACEGHQIRDHWNHQVRSNGKKYTQRATSFPHASSRAEIRSPVVP